MNPSFVSTVLPKVASGMAALGFSLFLVDCIDTRSEVPRRDAGDADVEPLATAVTIDVGAEKGVVAPLHYGMHSSVYDNALHHPELPDLIEEAGIALLRWPGGGYSDNYHWSNHSMTRFPDGNPGYLGPGTDFGGFVRVAESTGSAIMITVNYGSNLMSNGPGEPKEAAAWVAYANGDPGDEREIGVDGAGNDWLTVGYWASLRASDPEAEDDGRNFLRIAQPDPLGIEYWEIGNEVFGNGFHENNGSDGFELDLHVSYACRLVRDRSTSDPNDVTCSGVDLECDTRSLDECEEPEPERYGNPLLSGTTYGEGVVRYIDEMKAVDPDIKVGAVLGTPPDDYGAWMNRLAPRYHWNRDVLEACGEHIDFAIVHWYPNPPPYPEEDDTVQHTLLRVANLLAYPRDDIPVMVSELRELFAEHAGSNAENIELVMTEVGTGAWVPRGQGEWGALDRGHAMGIFAADMYLTAAELGFVNVDWLELHSGGTFLNEPDKAEDPHTKGPAFTGIQVAHLLAGPGDRLVTATSTKPSLVAHASVRTDGRVGVLLINTQAPEVGSERVTVTIDGASVSGRGERYDYLPAENVPADGGLPDASAPEAGALDGGAPVNARSGAVVGPEAFSDMQSPFALELGPYAVTLLLFDAPD